MKLPQALLVKLSPLVEAARGEPLVEPYVQVLERGEGRLQVASAYGRFDFDRGLRLVHKDGSEISRFDAIESVDLAGFPGGRGAPSWSITLYRGFLDRITIGRTYDDGEASVVGARLARLIGCKVVSLTGRRR